MDLFEGLFSGDSGEFQGRGGEGAVIDDEIDLTLVFYGLDYDFGFIFDYLRNKDSGNHFSKRKGLMSQEQTPLSELRVEKGEIRT